MNEYLIQTANPGAYLPQDYRHVQRTGQINGDTVLDILHDQNPTKGGDLLIGGWDRQGEQVEPVDVAAYESIRPLGNNPPRDIYDEDGNVIGQTRGGDATKDLVYHGFAGFGLRQIQSLRQLGATPDEPYPEDNWPFAFELRHKFYEDPQNPQWTSYMWRCELVGSAGLRDPGVHAVGVYRDPECTDYWYTTGAFTLQDSEWQTDEEGNPLQVWATEYNPAFQGEATQVPLDVHHAILYASVQRGFETLPGGDENNTSEHLYWDRIQGQPPPVDGEWVGTGQTVSFAQGQVVRVADTSAFLGGDRIRIDTREFDVTQVFSAIDLLVDPADADASLVGFEVERWQ